jgi:Family of unknown function (DUF6370)
MRKMIPMLAVAVLFSGLTLLVRAAEDKTVKGEAQCAKCKLQEEKKCRTVVVADGKKFYLAKNAEEKKFHGKICSGDVIKVTVTGSVKEEDGKQVLTASKIEVVEG